MYVHTFYMFHIQESIKDGSGLVSHHPALDIAILYMFPHHTDLHILHTIQVLAVEI